MKLKTLDDFNFKGRKVLLRVDLNSEVDDGKVVISPRIIQSAKTILELKRKKARVVVIAHQSRKGEKDFISLKQHAKLLKVKFAADIIGEKALKEINSLKNGEALLLENVRFNEDELNPKKKNNSLIKTLAPLFDIYINDAFSVSHREQTSITEFPKVLPSGIGRTMEHELNNLEKLKIKDALYILGGSKDENAKIIKNCDGEFLTCGVFGQLCAIAKGVNFGAQNKFLEKQISETVPKIKNFKDKITIPLDFAVNANGKRKEIKIEDFPSEFEIFDIGEKTIDFYISRIKKAKVILMKGTAGFCEEKEFCKGTETLLKAIVSSKAFSVLGGGHLSTAVEKLKINKNKFDYISLSGGAFVSYLVGEKLPGLAALENSPKTKTY